MQARKYTSPPWPSNIGPPKAIRISSFGSTHVMIGKHFVFGILLLMFLPNSVQGCTFCLVYQVSINKGPSESIRKFCHSP